MAKKESNLHNILYTISLLLAISSFYEASEVVKRISLPRMRSPLPDHCFGMSEQLRSQLEASQWILCMRMKNLSDPVQIEINFKIWSSQFPKTQYLIYRKSYLNHNFYHFFMNASRDYKSSWIKSSSSPHVDSIILHSDNLNSIFSHILQCRLSFFLIIHCSRVLSSLSFILSPLSRILSRQESPCLHPFPLLCIICRIVAC